MSYAINDQIYTSSGTDITLRWKKLYNWTPPSEQQSYIAKWKAFRELAAKEIYEIKRK